MAQRVFLRAIGSPKQVTLELPPVFLAPALQKPFTLVQRQACGFSTSTSLCHPRGPRDKNRNRGVSAIRMTGPKKPLSAANYPLPQPVFDPKRRPRASTDENHGLWQFFNENKTAMSTPEEDFSFGRAWTYAELRNKHWNDLHSLWWVCVKERNRVATSSMERERVHAGYGEFESNARDEAIQETQKQIRRVLEDRWYSWEEARKLWNKGVRPEEDVLDASELQETEGDVSSGTPPRTADSGKRSWLPWKKRA